MEEDKFNVKRYNAELKSIYKNLNDVYCCMTYKSESAVLSELFEQ